MKNKWKNKIVYYPKYPKSEISIGKARKQSFKMAQQV